MGDLVEVYESTRQSIIDVLRERSPEDFDRSVPATPMWTVKNVIAHLVGDIECSLRNDFPREFFESFGDAAAVVKLNKWTDAQIRERDDHSFQELVDEWDRLVEKLYPMMRGDQKWPEGMPFFADRVLLTDLGVHQQDIYGAFGLERDREGAPVKIGVAGYIATMDWRLRSDQAGKLNFEADKQWAAGEGRPEATVRASRFELFRALSGRRSLDQLRSYEWVGDAEPFLPYFYPYGVRSDELVE